MSLRHCGLFLLLHVVTGWLFLHDVGPGFPLDDAWGHMVYARALASGEGFAYNPDVPEAGVTSPLWTTLAAVPVGLNEWIGHETRPDWGVRALGAACALLAALVGFRLAGRAGFWPAVFAGALLSIDPLLIVGRFSGMELPLFALLTLLLAEAIYDENLAKTGVVVGLAILTRPEALLLLPLALTMLWRHRRGMLALLLPIVLCVLPFIAWNLWVSGNAWPNTWQNKAEFVFSPTAIGSTLAALVQDTGWGWALPVLLIAGALTLEGGARRLAQVTGLIGITLLIGVLVTRPMPVDAGLIPPRVPFYWERYALIAWPLLLVLLGAGLSAFVRTAWAGVYCRPVAAALLVSPLLVTGYLARGLPAHTASIAGRFSAECADVEALNVAAGVWIREHLPDDALVAAHDAGAIRFFGLRPVLDIYGNNDHRLNALIRVQDRAIGAKAHEQSEAAILDYLLALKPDALAVFPAAWAREHSPEFQRIMAAAGPQERQQLNDIAQDYAGFFGLTQRAVTFHVADPAVIGSPLHQDLAIFVRP